MYELALVMIGGAVGSALRYGVSHLVAPVQGTFPWSTFMVNIVGSFVLGVLIGTSLVSTAVSRPLLLLLGTGLCGGFTTYSAFAVETVLLAQEGHIPTAATYVIATLLCCAVAAFAGILTPRLFSH